MEAKPLETIPEETVAPATTNKNITSDVPKTKPATAKNPGRVASGKRLAERNRLAREAKTKGPKHKNHPQTKLSKQAAAQTRQNNQAAAAAQTRATLFWGLVVLLSLLLVCITNVKLIMRTIGRSPKIQTTQPAPAESNTVKEPGSSSSQTETKIRNSRVGIILNLIYTHTP